MNTNMFKLMTSRAINKIGNIFYDYGNSVWLASMGTVGKQFLAFYQMADTLTSILFNPISGAIVDRFKRRKILLVTDMLCAILCLMAAMVTNDQVMLYVLIVVNIVLAISSSFSRIANKSFITEIVPKEEILTYNSRLEAILQVIGVSSPIFSFIVLHYTSLRVTLLIDAMSFLLSFGLIYAIRPQEKEIRAQAKRQLTVKSVLVDIMAGIGYIRQEKEVLFLLVIAACVNFILAGLTYLLPFSNQLFGSETAYASLLSMGAIGSILAAIVSGRLKGSMNNLLLSLLLSGTGVVVIGLSAWIAIPNWLSYSGNLLAEFFMTIFNIHFFSQIQTRVAQDFMGRVFSAIYTIAIFFMPVGTWLISRMPSAIQLTSFSFIGGGVVLLAILAMVYQTLQKRSL